MADIKIELPKKWYTIEDLAERWGCRKEEIQHLIETKILTAHKRYEFENLNDLDGFNNKIRRVKNFLGNTGNVKVNIVLDTSQDYLIVIPAEVDRFELERGICWNETLDKTNRPSALSINSLKDTDILTLAEHGKKFKAKGRGKSKIRKLIYQIQKKHYESEHDFLTWKQMRIKLECESGRGVVDKVDDEIIYWIGRLNNETKEMTDTQLQSCMTDVKKEILS